jgi:hypothetical protein
VTAWVVAGCCGPILLLTLEGVGGGVQCGAVDNLVGDGMGFDVGDILWVTAYASTMKRCGLFCW